MDTSTKQRQKYVLSELENTRGAIRESRHPNQPQRKAPFQKIRHLNAQESKEQESQEMERRAMGLSMAREVAARQDAFKGLGSAAKDISAANASSRFSIITSATKLALKHRQKIKQGDLSVFLLPFVFALAKDSILDLIPIFGQFFGLFITVYLFIFLWGKGRLKWRIVRSILLFLDMLVPLINIIPFTTFVVYITYKKAKKQAENSKETIRTIHREVNNELSEPVLI